MAEQTAGILDTYFQNPAGLWLLLLAAPIVIVHLLKFRPRRVTWPSLRLWREAAAEPVANTFWQRIRAWRELALQLTALLFISLALAGTQLPNGRVLQRQAVFFVDLSASMSAMSSPQSTQTRLDLAKDNILRRLESAGPDDGFGLVSFDSQVTVLVPPGSPPAAVREALESLVPTMAADLPNAWAEELRQLWLSLRDEADVYLVTGPLEFSVAQSLPGELGIVSLGQPMPNQGITQAVLTGPTPANGTATIDAAMTPGQQPLLLEELSGDTWKTLDARAPAPFVRFELPPSQAPRTFRLRLERGDAFPADDAVTLAVPPATSLKLAATVDDAPLTPAPEETAAPLARLLYSLGARVDATTASPGTLRAVPGALAALITTSSSKPRLSYAKHAWWEGLALEHIELQNVSALQDISGYRPLLMLDGQPLAAERSGVRGGHDLLLASSLLKDNTFLRSDAFVTLIGRWYRQI